MNFFLDIFKELMQPPGGSWVTNLSKDHANELLRDFSGPATTLGTPPFIQGAATSLWDSQRCSRTLAGMYVVDRWGYQPGKAWRSSNNMSQWLVHISTSGLINLKRIQVMPTSPTGKISGDWSLPYTAQPAAEGCQWHRRTLTMVHMSIDKTRETEKSQLWTSKWK